MLTRRPVVAGSLLMLVATALLISFFFLGSLRLQHVNGLDAFRTGLLFLPVALTTAIGAHLGSRLVTTAGPRVCAAAGTALAAAGCLPLALLPPPPTPGRPSCRPSRRPPSASAPSSSPRPPPPSASSPPTKPASPPASSTPPTNSAAPSAWPSPPPSPSPPPPASPPPSPSAPPPPPPQP
ncbi:hypothetical protein O1L60_19835 [Streptomyces diastatochromogenes]|nr:hypothetical protein [Streptomyces diastatochromogenes]